MLMFKMASSFFTNINKSACCTLDWVWNSQSESTECCIWIIGKFQWLRRLFNVNMPYSFFSVFQVDKTGLLGDSYGISAQQWARSRWHYSDTRSAECHHGGSTTNSGERRQHVIYRWRGISSQWLHSTVSRDTLFDQIETKGKQDRCKNNNIFAFDWLENNNLFFTI